jgi:hypothetical protein
MPGYDTMGCVSSSAWRAALRQIGISSPGVVFPMRHMQLLHGQAFNATSVRWSLSLRCLQLSPFSFLLSSLELYLLYSVGRGKPSRPEPKALRPMAPSQVFGRRNGLRLKGLERWSGLISYHANGGDQGLATTA